MPHGEVARYYSLVDLLVYPRKSMRLTETVTPLKPLEAMAQGRLLIASDVGGHRELIQDGVTGFLFRPDDPAALAIAVRRVLAERERWDDIRDAGRRFVETERNWRASVARYPAVYERARRGGWGALMARPLQGAAGRAAAAAVGRHGEPDAAAEATAGRRGRRGRAGADQCAVPSGVGRRSSAACGQSSGWCRTCARLPREAHGSTWCTSWRIPAGRGTCLPRRPIAIARCRGGRLIVNYRGGLAEEFLARSAGTRPQRARVATRWSCRRGSCRRSSRARHAGADHPERRGYAGLPAGCAAAGRRRDRCAPHVVDRTQPRAHLRQRPRPPGVCACCAQSLPACARRSRAPDRSARICEVLARRTRH